MKKTQIIEILEAIGFKRNASDCHPDCPYLGVTSRYDLNRKEGLGLDLVVYWKLFQCYVRVVDWNKEGEGFGEFLTVYALNEKELYKIPLILERYSLT